MLRPVPRRSAPLSVLCAVMFVAVACGSNPAPTAGTTGGAGTSPGASGTAGTTGAPGTSAATPAATSPVTSAATSSASDGLVSIGAGLQGRSGLSAAVYATGLQNVAAFAFDSDGRLWASTAAFTDAGTDAVFLVTGSGATPLAVIPSLHTPLGLLWLDEELYVASKERVDAYSGFNGTAFDKVRQVLSLPAGVGEVNGMALGPDGRIRLGVSAPCDHCVPASVYSAAILTFAPDGSGLSIRARGIRAPIGLAYVPGTEDLLVTMNQRDDLGDATPGDWLTLVLAGDTYGFPDCYGQADPVCDGTPAPIAVLDKHAAVSGIAIVTGAMAVGTGAAGDELAAIVAEWATGKVLAVQLTATTTSYTGAVQPYVTGLTNPVAVALAPDGTLALGDWSTGTVYRVVPPG
jgi:glucose/arabinose dehydrogenase